MEVVSSRVCRYERAIPGVLRLPFTSQSPGSWTCFTYAIRFRNFKPGTDPIQHSASEFLLLSPQTLDKEASTMSMHLNLPDFASVESHLSYCGPLILNYEKVEILKKFNVWLFHLALGKCFTLPTIAGEGAKNYYVVPCNPVDNACEQNPEKLINWHDVETALGSSLLYRRKVHFFGGYAKLETGSFGSVDPPEKGRLRMRNGTFGEDELDDAIVTCANNGLPCYIAGILHDLSGNSVYPQSAGHVPMTYAEHYLQKCKYTLQFPDQPLLKGYRLVRAGNYLRRTSMILSNGDIARSWETMELPPEVCILHVNLKGKLCRGAMRLPSILHSLEMTLVAAELRDHIGPSFSCFKVEHVVTRNHRTILLDLLPSFRLQCVKWLIKILFELNQVQEALTSGACEGNYSYETLELLGDSVLNFVGGVHMYIDYPSYTSQKLHVCRHEVVSNRNLYSCGLACGLPGYIFAELLNTKTWVPPGPALEDLPQCLSVRDDAFQYTIEGQIIGLKTLADVVEALVGVYLLHGSLKSALQAMTWLRIPMPFPAKVPDLFLDDLQEQMRMRNELGASEIAIIEKMIAYHFKNKYLLMSAFDYGNDITFNEAGIPIGGFAFQRLEFLGDSVLDFLITRHLVRLYPQFDPQQLNDLRQATVNCENFACVAISHGLHIFLQKMSPILANQISLYTTSLDREGPSPFGIPSQASPRAVGDLMQTLAGSILLDSNFDIEIVWKVLEPLLKPLATPETVMLHPRRQLETLCHKLGLSMEMQSIQSDGAWEASVYINQVFVASSQHTESTVARRLAAFKALRSLSPEPSSSNFYASTSRLKVDARRAQLCAHV